MGKQADLGNDLTRLKKQECHTQARQMQALSETSIQAKHASTSEVSKPSELHTWSAFECAHEQARKADDKATPA